MYGQISAWADTSTSFGFDDAGEADLSLFGQFCLRETLIESL